VGHRGNLEKTGCFIMFSMITNIYNNKTKEPTLMKLFTFLQLEIFDVCRVTGGAHIESL